MQTLSPNDQQARREPLNKRTLNEIILLYIPATHSIALIITYYYRTYYFEIIIALIILKLLSHLLF